jgi:thiamine transporter ThiT
MKILEILGKALLAASVVTGVIGGVIYFTVFALPSFAVWLYEQSVGDQYLFGRLAFVVVLAILFVSVFLAVDDTNDDPKIDRHGSHNSPEFLDEEDRP